MGPERASGVGTRQRRERSPEEGLSPVQRRRWAMARRALMTVLSFSLVLGISLLLWAYVFRGCGPRKQNPRALPPGQPSLSHGPHLPICHPEDLCPWIYMSLILTSRAPRAPRLFLPESHTWPLVRSFRPHQGLPSFPSPGIPLPSPLGEPSSRSLSQL